MYPVLAEVHKYLTRQMCCYLSLDFHVMRTNLIQILDLSVR